MHNEAQHQPDTALDAELARILAMPDDELMAQPGAAESVAKTREIIAAAVVRATHDRMDWMTWESGKAIVLDGCHYFADLDDGRAGVEVIANVYDADEVGFCEPSSPDDVDAAPERLRWLGF